VCEKDLVHSFALCQHDAPGALHEADEVIAVPFVIVDLNTHEKWRIVPNGRCRRRTGVEWFRTWQ
jgi:hypothetical protein